jgi:hypothetical protein
MIKVNAEIMKRHFKHRKHARQFICWIIRPVWIVICLLPLLRSVQAGNMPAVYYLLLGEESSVYRGGIKGYCGVIGDSIGEATHTNDACHRYIGDHQELMECLNLRLGSHDLDWSFMGGTQSWSIANRLDCKSVNNTAKDGEEWKDAFDQAQAQVQTWNPATVILQLGSNDVCADFGHDYGSLAFVQPTTPANIISIEAEHFIERFASDTHQWQPDDMPGASILAVRALPDNGISMNYPEYLTSGPRMDYRINFTRAGIHYVWIRGFAGNATARLVHIGLNGQRQRNAESMLLNSQNEWVWSRSAENTAAAYINVPSAGEHTLNVYMHQDGLRLDKLVLTSSSSWEPAGDGPVESGRGVFMQEDTSGSALAALEAEHFQQSEKSGNHHWAPDFRPGFSGNAAMRALPNSGISDGTAESPWLSYHVDFNSSGTFYIWVRGYATGVGNDSVRVAIDDTGYETASTIQLPSHNNWVWSNHTTDGRISTLDIDPAGIHTLNIWMHEDGFRLDKIVLTDQPDYVPSGMGPTEQWDNDLGRIGGHIDDTMMYLTENLGPKGEIYWSGTADISEFRNLMVERKHDHAFKKCQHLWDMDLDSDTLQGDAKDSLCKGELGILCDFLPAELRDRLIDAYIIQFQEQFGDDQPCGRMLDSRNTQEDRDEARRFNKSLNDLMEQKAAQYQGRKQVQINFTQILWYRSDQIGPYLISHIDCYHPNRLGQMKLAQMVWQGHEPDFIPTDEFYFEGFDSDDWCSQEFTTWESCWYDGGWGSCGAEFICYQDSSGWFKFGKETGSNEDHWIARDVADLSDKSEIWAYFKHKRDQFDNDRSDWVSFSVWDGAVWIEIERFRTENDAGVHCSQYYNLTAYKNAIPFKFRFLTNNSDDMENGDKLMLDDISIFAW